MEEIINGLLVREGKLLVVKKRNIWVFPGSKLENESYIGCLKREFRENLSGTEIYNFKPYKNFKEIMLPSKIEVIVRTNFVDLKGRLGNPSKEISDVKYVPLFSNPQLNFSKITWDVMLSLRKDGYLALY